MMFQVLGYTVLLWACCNAQNDDCGPPPRRNNEELTDTSGKQTYSHNEQVFYNCRPGYIKLGRIRMRCNNGNWEQVPPYVECRKRPCGHPGDIQFGSFELINGDEFVFGSRVVYQCDPGYQMLSQTNYRDCRANGWSNDIPHCEVKKCFPVKPPKNGRIVMTGIYSLDQDFTFGQALQFECNPKFKIMGSKQIVCSDRGQWHPDVPTCQEITCEIGNIENGDIIPLKDVYKDGDEIQLDCHERYKPVDRPGARCSENGWSTRLECTEIVCSRPEVNNAKVNPHRQQYSFAETIQIQCESGYEPEQQRDNSRCTKNGWVPQPKCVPKRCDYPQAENLEVYDYRWYFPKRERYDAHFRCINGFLPARKTTDWQRITCTKYGWNPEPKCFKQCDHRRGFPGGNFIYHHWHKFIEGNEISFSCDEGYYPEPQEARSKCTKNGWSPTPSCISREIPTCKSDPPGNGFFADQKDQFALNEMTRYRCQIGFTTREGLEEGETRCLREGWTPKPECIQTCQEPTEGNVIISITKRTFLLEEILSYTCEDGYETISKALEDNSKCTASGWNPRPQCLPIQCEILSLDHGVVHPRQDQYLYNDVVQFTCRAGRVRVGPVSAQCYHFGWSPPPPVCKAPVDISSCQPPSNITDGRIITALQEEYKHGQQVEYECNLKYAMTGSPKIECVDGRWTSLPSCTEEKRTCGQPASVSNGHIPETLKQQYFHGETLRYECANRFEVVGKCVHGQWDLPSCSDGCACPVLPKNIKPTPRRTCYKNNDIVRYSCDFIQGTTKCVNGKWSPKPDCRELCPSPPQLPNATEIIEVRKYENGEKIRLSCKDHFLLEGPQELLCEDGKWKKPPQCIDASCGNPPPIANGTALNGTQGRYLPGTEVEYHCDEGFDSTEIFSTCKNRLWTPVPVCEEKPCGPPPRVIHATLGYTKRSYRPGETVRYVCNPRFVADRPPEVTCRKGQWTEQPTCKDAVCGDPPTVANAAITSGRSEVYRPNHQVEYRCQEGFEMSGSDTVTCEMTEWSKPPTCEDATCPPPNGIVHGAIIGQPKERYMPSETVHYQCDQGWRLSGPNIVTCFNKQWTNLPQCKNPNANCGRPPVIQNGDVLSDVLRSTYPPGTRLQYQCQNFYVMNGSPEVHCQNGVWTQTPTCIEACTISEEDMAHNNIQLKWKNAPKLYSKSGDVIEFECKWNYTPDPSTPHFRIYCVNGRVEYPRCVSHEYSDD